MSSQRVNLTTATPSQAGRISTIKLVSQSVTGPPGADGAGVSVATKENGTQVVAVTTALDFLGADFNVTESPSGEANVSLAVTPQPSDADLTAIAALTTTAYGRALLELANQAALLAVLGTGTPSSTTYLRGDGSWAAAGGAVESRALAASGAYATAAYGAPGMSFYSHMTNWIANGNVLNYWPAVWNKDSVITDVAITVVSGYAATQSRIGLYACDAQWTPTSLVAEFGTFDHTTSGTKTITGLSQAVTGLTRYLVGFVANGQFRASASLGSCVFGGYGQSSIAPGASPATVNFTYGSLPASGPAPTAWPGFATAVLAGMKWTTA